MSKNCFFFQFLSFHSEYFDVLFNSEFKEKTMDEIPIEAVDYDDFARLLSVVYPNPIIPTCNYKIRVWNYRLFSCSQHFHEPSGTSRSLHDARSISARPIVLNSLRTHEANGETLPGGQQLSSRDYENGFWVPSNPRRKISKSWSIFNCLW